MLVIAGSGRERCPPPSNLCRGFLELGALAGAVPCARLHARLVLAEWGLAALSETLELVTSELVTNGVRASRAMGRDAVRPRRGTGEPAQAARPGRRAASSRADAYQAPARDEPARLEL